MEITTLLILVLLVPLALFLVEMSRHDSATFRCAFCDTARHGRDNGRDNGRDIPTALNMGLLGIVGAGLSIYKGVKEMKYAKEENERQRRLQALYQQQINEAMRQQRAFAEQQRQLAEEAARQAERDKQAKKTQYAEAKRDKNSFSLRLTQGLGGLGGG